MIWSTARGVVAAGPYCIADARMDRQTGSLPAGFIAYLGVMLETSAGQVIGTVCSFHRAAPPFDGGDVAVARVLEPFYTTKEGTGLGLAIASGIVEALGGRFSIEQDETGAVTAQAILPASVEAADESSLAARRGGRVQSLHRSNGSSLSGT